VSPTLNAFDNTAEVRATVLIFEATRVDDTRLYDKYSPTVATYWGTGGARVPYVINEQMPVRRLKCSCSTCSRVDHPRYTR